LTLDYFEYIQTAEAKDPEIIIWHVLFLLDILLFDDFSGIIFFEKMLVKM